MGRARHRRLWGALVAAVLLVTTAAMPGVAMAGGTAARTVTGVRADDTPGPTDTSDPPSQTQPVPQPSATETEPDDTDPPEPVDPSLIPPAEPVVQGGTFTVIGRDFDCADGGGLAGPLTFTMQGQGPVPLTVDDSGGFAQPVSVPEDAAPGQYVMTARCASVVGPTAQAVVDVVAAARPGPRMSLSSGSGRPGNHVGVEGTGFLCDVGAGADILWDGQSLTSGTLSQGGALTASFHVPPSTAEGEHEVRASCQDPEGVQASAVFRVEPPPVTPPPDDQREVTIHMADYPAVCARGSIAIGGRPLKTWLDADSYQGGAKEGRWELIDLHAKVPTDMTGRRNVELQCAGRNTEKAGEISLPPPDPLTLFQLPLGSTKHPEGKKGPIAAPPAKSLPSKPGDSSPTPGKDRDKPDSQGSDSPTDDGKKDDGGNGGRDSSPDDPSLGLAGALRTPADVSWALKDLAGSVGMAAWFLIVILLLEKAFPSQLADNALGRWWLRRQERRRTRPTRLPGWVRVCGFALLGGSLAVWADKATTWRLADRGQDRRCGRGDADHPGRLREDQGLLVAPAPERDPL
ncbi:hypothetical protein RB200_34585 [Streptomyces sp. PmtG]